MMRKELSEIAEKYKVWTIYAFGSRAREIAAAFRDDRCPTGSSTSDVDIGVHYKKDFHPTALDKVLLAQELENLFQVPRVDVVDVGTADSFLSLDIIRGEILYCSDMYSQSAFELYILRRAADLAPFERQRRKQILERV